MELKKNRKPIRKKEIYILTDWVNNILTFSNRAMNTSHMMDYNYWRFRNGFL